jgi:thiamine monophosphate synthase
MEISGNLIPIVAIAGGLVAGVVALITTCIQSVAKSRARERTRREVAAYVAEGSMSAEEGERLLKAGLSSKDTGCCG